MKKIQIILGIIVSLLVLQACGASRTTDATPVVHLATDMKPKTLHPHHASEGPSFQSIGQYSQTLLVYNESGELVPGAATSFTVSEDGMLYTFALRPDAKWSNGEQVMAADFVFAWQTLAQDEKAYYRDFLKHLANGAAVIAGELPIDELGVVAVDEFTLEIRLARPVAYFLDILAFPTLAPLNQVFYQSVADTYGTSAETVLANGPYVISKYEPEALLQFTKNEQYWDSEHVQVAEVQVRIVEEPATQSLLYDSGEIDMLTLTGDLNDKYANDPSVQVGHTPSIVYMYLSPVAQAGNEVLANKSFRQAISLAIDKELLTETVLKDGSKPLEGLVPENFGAYDGKSYREISGKHTTAVYNQTKAQALLQRAKDELGAIPLSFQLAYPESAVFKKVYEILKIK